MKKKLLILTGGPKKKLDAFVEPAKDLGLAVTLASFADLTFLLSKQSPKIVLKVKDQSLAEFDLIYIRMVGKRLEDATLVVNFAVEKGITIIDRVYEKALFVPSTISKAAEMTKLIAAGIPLPDTYFGSLYMIGDKALAHFPFPFVIKSTSGKKARDAWLVKDTHELNSAIEELRVREKQGVRFFAQELIKASQRIRVLVVGGRAIGALTRPTKWRKHFVSPVGEEIPDGLKEALIPVPEKYWKLGVTSANAVDLDIAGVDILEEDGTKNLYVIEANAAPSWNLIKKDCGVDVEKEILEYLASLVR